MTYPTKTASLSFLLLILFFLAGCAKPPLALKPRPATIPRKTPIPEFPLMRLEVNGQNISPLVPTLFMLPEDPIVIRIQPENTQATGNQARSRPEREPWSVVLNGHPLTSDGNNFFSGTVPKAPGFYLLGIQSRQKSDQGSVSQNSSQGQRMGKTGPTLLLIVLHPFSRLKDGFIDLFPMGFYPNPVEAPKNIIPQDARSNYLPPQGFIEVTPENQGLLISKHYRLEEFSPRLKTPFSHFLALSPALLLKLELLTLKLEFLVNPQARLTIISGFRTPGSNQAGSGALWSRHIYGDAADIIVDISPQDGQMDDLNQDGRINREDALFLARLMEEIEEETGLPGGLGVYDWGKNGQEGPYIHIDTRGFKARW